MDFGQLFTMFGVQDLYLRLIMLAIDHGFSPDMPSLTFHDFKCSKPHHFSLIFEVFYFGLNVKSHLQGLLPQES